MQRILRSADGSGRPRSRGITFDRLLAIVVVLLPIVVALRFSMATIDIAYGIRAGEIMLRSHDVLRIDVFTFTAYGDPWLNQQWLAEIGFAWLFRHGGWETIALVRAAFAALVFWLVFRACREAGAATRPAAWLAIAALVVSTYGLVPRPQLFAVVFFAATLWIVARRERHPRGLWLLPLIVLPWANVHGSFPLVPVLLGCVWLEDRRARRPGAGTVLLVAVATVLASFVNPFGLRVWSYVVSLSTNEEIRSGISEWRPPDPTTFAGAMFFLSVLAVAAIVWRARDRVPWPRYVALGILFLLGATAVRGIVWWTLAAPVLIADLVPAPARDDEPRLVNTAAVAVLVALAVLWLPWFRPLASRDANSLQAIDGLLSFAPAEHLTRLDDLTGPTDPPTRVFAAQVWASWVELEVPDVRVTVDPRIELFPSSVWDDYDAISAASANWRELLDEWSIDVLMLSTLQQSPLIAALERDPTGWTEVYRDANGALLVRST